MSEISRTIEERYSSGAVLSKNEKMELLLKTLVAYKELTERVLSLEKISDEVVEIPDSYDEQLKMLLEVVSLSGEYSELEEGREKIKVLERRINSLYDELDDPVTKPRLDALLLKYGYTKNEDTSSRKKSR